MSYIDVVEKIDIPRPRKHYTEPYFEEVLGLPIAYRREGAGEAAVLFHGAGFTRMWLPFYAMLAEKAGLHCP